jgi:glycosyltransferase involved in cell wall biosynthesis
MKIAVIAPTQIPARRANTLQVMKMTQAMAIIGHTVCLLAPKSNGHQASTNKPGWDELASHYGLRHPFPIEWLPAADPLRRYDFSWRAVRWARRWEADLIYTRLPQAAALASQLGSRVIFELHDFPQGTLGPKILHWFLNGRGAYHLVLITRALASDLQDRFDLPANSNLVVIVPDGVDLERYTGLPAPQPARLALAGELAPERRASLIPEHFTLGYTGHLYAGRGVELLLALAARLPEMNFLIVGGEPQEVDNLRQRVQVAGLNNVILTGFIPNAELPRYQAACDVLLMPYQRQVAASSGGDISRYLSPMKLFEYLACERPIVSSDLPVLREVLNTENSLLLPGDDIDAWTSALQRLEADQGLCQRLAARARQDAEHYTWEARAKKILFEHLTAGGKIERKFFRKANQSFD